MTFTPTPETAVLRGVVPIDLLAFPGGPQIGTIRRNEPIKILYNTEIIDGWVWLEVQDKDGRIGWIPQYMIMMVTETPTPSPTSTP